MTDSGHPGAATTAPNTRAGCRTTPSRGLRHMMPATEEETG